MRDLDSAWRSFQELKKFQSLPDLKIAVRCTSSEPKTIATEGCRSICWKIFLLFETLDTSTWQKFLLSSRSAYNSLREHFLRDLDYPNEQETAYDPLSNDREVSSQTQPSKDEELRAEILQDVARCMPENLYFRQPDTQQMLLDILFVFCKLNPDVSYRQGMHELLAPILWVIERDAIDIGQDSKTMGEDAFVKDMFDARHIEHDAFALFSQMMHSAKNFYEQTTTSGTENPIVARSQKIFNHLLPQVDRQLAKHLEDIQIVPQIFLMRWVRLLFGREFAFDEMLMIWDVILAEDPSLDIVNDICLTMLLRIRWQLMDADYNAALPLLLHYPETEDNFLAQTFALDALYLREHMNYHGGSHLVTKYTGRSIPFNGRPVTPPAIQKDHVTVSGGAGGTKVNRSSMVLPPNGQASARDINRVIQSTAKDLYARGERLGIGKAVRSAMDEVHKRAQEIRDTQTPAAPIRHRTRGSRSSLGQDSLISRIKKLEDRNVALAKMLESAVSDLWKYQQLVIDKDAHQNAPDVEMLNAAIAQTQFVQVYLADSKIALPDDLMGHTATANENGALEQSKAEGSKLPEVQLDGPTNKIDPLQTQTDPPDDSQSSRALVSDAHPFDIPASTALRQDQPQYPDIVATNDEASPDAATHQERPVLRSTVTSRPRLEQSSFSWMLGDQSSSERAFPRTSNAATGRTGNKGFLFGEGTL